MLQLVGAKNPRGNSLEIPLENLTSGYNIQDISGLGPVKATLVSSSFAQYDGDQYQSSRREKRNIVITIGMNPDYGTGQTVSAMRRALYNFFMPKSEVKLSFTDSDIGKVYIDGRVESTEPAIFSADPAVVISIVCFNPDFYDDETFTVAGSTTSTTATTAVNYLGDIPAGIKLKMTSNRSLSGFTIYNSSEGMETQKFDFSGNVLNGQTININTNRGNKSARLTSVTPPSVTSVLYNVDPVANWITLNPGLNNFRVYASGAAIPYTVEYVNLYGGL